VEIISLLRGAFSSSICECIEKQHEVDLSFLCEKVRYRANFNKQQGTQAFSFRVVPQKIPKLDDLQLPGSVAALVQEPRGLLLVTGAAGQGKARPPAPCCNARCRLRRQSYSSAP